MRFKTRVSIWKYIKDPDAKRKGKSVNATKEGKEGADKVD